MFVRPAKKFRDGAASGNCSAASQALRKTADVRKLANEFDQKLPEE
jgi:hypothetical protein